MAEKCENAKITELREKYRAFRLQCGWHASDIAEMDAVIRADVADGQGSERPFEFHRSDRIDCWTNWLAGKGSDYYAARGLSVADMVLKDVAKHRGQPAADRLRIDALKELGK